LLVDFAGRQDQRTATSCLGPGRPPPILSRTLVATDEGSLVTYEADLRLKTPLRSVIDPLLALAFRRIGTRASSGLHEALNT
jgi:hypothetical protein